MRSVIETTPVVAMPNLRVSSVPRAVATRSLYETGFPSTSSRSASATLIE